MVVSEGDGLLEWNPGASIGEPEINIDLAVFPEATLRRLAETRWFVFWEFSQARIVHDPTGIAERNQVALRSRFAAHPEVTRVWEELMAAFGRSKRTPGIELPYGGREGVEKRLETLLAGKTDTEHRR